MFTPLKATGATGARSCADLLEKIKSLGTECHFIEMWDVIFYNGIVKSIYACKVTVINSIVGRN